MKEACPICQPDQFIRPHFAKLGLPSKIDKVPLFETDHFVILPDILSVTMPKMPHLVMAPKRHVYSYAQLPWRRYREWTGEALKEVSDFFGCHLSVGEHGGTMGGNNVQSVYHAHWHLFPNGERRLTEHMADVLQRTGIEFTLRQCESNPLDTLRDVSGVIDGGGYLFFQDGHYALIVVDRGNSLPSLLTQGAMSRLCNNGEVLNWKKIPDDDQLARLSAQRVIETVDLCQR